MGGSSSLSQVHRITRLGSNKKVFLAGSEAFMLKKEKVRSAPTCSNNFLSGIDRIGKKSNTSPFSFFIEEGVSEQRATNFKRFVNEGSLRQTSSYKSLYNQMRC